MPPRSTRKSYRPRVSDRTMVGTSQPHCLLALEVESVVTITDASEKRKNQSLPTLRRLERRQTSLLLPVAGELFFLDSPLYRTGLPPKSVLASEFPICRQVGLLPGCPSLGRKTGAGDFMSVTPIE